MAVTTVSPIAQGTIRGFLHHPEQPTGRALVLAHGAGGNSQAPLLVAVASAFCETGFIVLRCDLPFRQRRPFGPPMPGAAAEDRAGLRAAAELLRDMCGGSVSIGGHSYGGRQASMLAAEEPESCAGLLLLSYPLHPPKKPTELRTAHFGKIEAPTLFVHGSRDPFGSIEELREAAALIPATTELVCLEGAGHDLRRGKFDVEADVIRKFETLMRAKA